MTSVIKKIYYFFLFSIICTLIYTGCVPPQEDTIQSDLSLNLQDITLQHIFDLQDKRLRDSLYTYFHHSNPAYRYQSVLAFGSIKDSLAIDSLAGMLKDNVLQVRNAAAFALGQIGNVKAERHLLNAYERTDSVGIYHPFNAAIMEAIGKCGSDSTLSLLASVKGFTKADSILLLGQTLGIYHYSLRGIIRPEGTQKMFNYVTDTSYNDQVREVSSSYLARAKSIYIDSLKAVALCNVLKIEKNITIKANLALAIGKSKTLDARVTLANQYDGNDYHVQTSILRAIHNFNYDDVSAIAYKGIADKNPNVSITASEYFYENGDVKDAGTYWQKAKDSTLHWNTRAILYRAANKFLYPQQYNELISNEIKSKFENSNNAYEKAALIHALAEYGPNYAYIREKTFGDKDAVVRVAGVEAIANLCKHPQFFIIFKGRSNAARSALGGYLLEAINSGDAGMIAAAAFGLRENVVNFKILIKDYSALQTALSKLKLPKEVETYNELLKAIDYFSGTEIATPLKKNSYNNPIDWNIYRFTTVRTKASIQTNKGTFVIQLLPLEAPGTVANFVKLVNSSFLKDKYFHRVVPNFVIQTGCPRGDGFGSLDYSIRSEFSQLRYDDEGWVGMASSGDDTEGTQWFVTQMAAPHLNGRYTIFAKVLSGMDVINTIEIGDKMINVSLVD
ncbi:MAG: peptidylprolyl isomerase [Saprospiraceae bacterium]|nr:peptidylprolyl isomerase [Saprospiraceae bacterium]